MYSDGVVFEKGFAYLHIHTVQDIIGNLFLTNIIRLQQP